MTPRQYHFSNRRNWNSLKILVLEYITKLSETFTAKEVAEVLKEPLPRIQMELLRLKRQGLIRRYGTAGKNHAFNYELKENGLERLAYLKEKIH